MGSWGTATGWSRSNGGLSTLYVGIDRRALAYFNYIGQNNSDEIEIKLNQRDLKSGSHYTAQAESSHCKLTTIRKGTSSC